ncbi:hypothetical protein SAMN06297468_1418 [Altererythrobacter xiamenensis]|uniref:Uncharacterized protein n=1 Tax=Altererythrobacter xiamenensis TaxID=1316679 RepID=A0A1Y6F8X3_9SPHN|nr:hypothetical protein SAMN06297468_1418 [Altererythrobacter xiamenensis]
MAGLSINCHHGKEDLEEIPPQLNRGETLSMKAADPCLGALIDAMRDIANRLLGSNCSQMCKRQLRATRLIWRP